MKMFRLIYVAMAILIVVSTAPNAGAVSAKTLAQPQSIMNVLTNSGEIPCKETGNRLENVSSFLNE